MDYNELMKVNDERFDEIMKWYNNLPLEKFDVSINAALSSLNIFWVENRKLGKCTTISFNNYDRKHFIKNVYEDIVKRINTDIIENENKTDNFYVVKKLDDLIKDIDDAVKDIFNIDDDNHYLKMSMEYLENEALKLNNTIGYKKFMSCFLNK